VNRNTFYFKQQLKSNELNDDLQANIEQADRYIIADTVGDGILSGLEVEISSINDFVLEIKKGVAYKNGFRIHFPLNETRNISQYRGLYIYLTLAIKFERNNYDQKTDGLGNTIMYRNDESYQVVLFSDTMSPTIVGQDFLILADIVVNGENLAINNDRVKRLSDNLKLIDLSNTVKDLSIFKEALNQITLGAVNETITLPATTLSGLIEILKILRNNVSWLNTNKAGNGNNNITSGMIASLTSNKITFSESALNLLDNPSGIFYLNGRTFNYTNIPSYFANFSFNDTCGCFIICQRQTPNSNQNATQVLGNILLVGAGHVFVGKITGVSWNGQYTNVSITWATL